MLTTEEVIRRLKNYDTEPLESLNKISMQFIWSSKNLDFSKIFENIKNIDHPIIWNYIGFMYKYGVGVDKDFMKSIEYFEKSADLGNIIALNNLGHFYSETLHFDPKLSQYIDYVKAFKYFEKSADLGDNGAQNKLGEMYFGGQDGVEKNYVKAIEYFKKSAAQGNKWAYTNLSKIYMHGYGVEKNYFKALKYYKKSGYEYAAKCEVMPLLDETRVIDMILDFNKETISLKQRIKELEEENNELRYRPGNPGYQNAKDEFNMLSQQ